jgi:phospholipase C
MHGGLAFESFRTARPGSPLYEKGMRHWSLEQLAQDARNGALPQVSWVLPPELMSEHPGPSSPAQGAEFAAQVLNALTANPETWSRTVLFQCFDENDGMFDHVPPPAPPSYNADGTLAGGATLDLKGEYFSDPERKHLLAEDRISGTVRPWGLGPRVPMYVISPWSKGGWVNSQVFDHTSVAQFLEKRFDVTVPGIGAWHRSVCGDLTSAFDFSSPDDEQPPVLPDTRGSASLVAMAQRLPKPVAPAVPERPFQEAGVRPSRALPYDLAVESEVGQDGIALSFRNDGQGGAVFHVYDKRHLDRIPRRYTVEAQKSLRGEWQGADYDLWVLGPNGFVRAFAGKASGAHVEAHLQPRPMSRAIEIRVTNKGISRQRLFLHSPVYKPLGSRVIVVPPGGAKSVVLNVAGSGNWYDLTISADNFVRRFAGRVETGKHGVSDPAMGTG